jgi:hypothetical protein
VGDPMTDGQRFPSADLSTGASPDRHRALGSGELAAAWQLDEFFLALGPVMRLPPKDADTSDPRLQSAASPRRRPMVLTAVAVALAVAATGPSLLSGAFEHTQQVPSGLHGRWKTAAERYADRSFEFSADSLRLGVGGHDATYPIARVRHRDSSDAVVYTIEYRDGQSELEFALAIGPDSVAQIRNLPGLGWRRAQ